MGTMQQFMKQENDFLEKQNYFFVSIHGWSMTQEYEPCMYGAEHIR